RFGARLDRAFDLGSHLAGHWDFSPENVRFRKGIVDGVPRIAEIERGRCRQRTRVVEESLGAEGKVDNGPVKMWVYVLKILALIACGFDSVSQPYLSQRCIVQRWHHVSRQFFVRCESDTQFCLKGHAASLDDLPSCIL